MSPNRPAREQCLQAEQDHCKPQVVRLQNFTAREAKARLTAAPFGPEISLPCLNREKGLRTSGAGATRSDRNPPLAREPGIIVSSEPTDVVPSFLVCISRSEQDPKGDFRSLCPRGGLCPAAGGIASEGGQQPLRCNPRQLWCPVSGLSHLV